MDDMEFRIMVKRQMRDNPSWRYGQAVFNTMSELAPDVADKYRGSWVDPFYDNSKAEDFMTLCFNDIDNEGGWETE